MSTPILATKLYVPPPEPKVVPRQRLIGRLNEGLNRRLTLIVVFARLAMTVVMAVNVFNSLGVLLLSSDAEYLTVFEPGQLHALVLLFLNLHDSGVYIWQVFFGLHWLILRGSVNRRVA
jgi:hypothetical protein